MQRELIKLNKAPLTESMFRDILSECVNNAVCEEYAYQQGTERYEAVIHSDRFKQWFGDWENNPDESSIVVSGTDGKPIICTHGTDADFDTFSHDKIRGGSMACHGYGFNFAARESGYSHYGSKTVNAFVNVRNPLSSERKTLTVRDIYDILRKIDGGKDMYDTISYSYSGDAAMVMDRGNFDLGLRIAARNMYDYCEDDLAIYATVCQMNVNTDVKDVIGMFEKLGFDGSAEYIDGRLEYVIAFRPDQVKRIGSNFTRGEGNMNLEERRIRKPLLESGTKSIIDTLARALLSDDIGYRGPLSEEDCITVREYDLRAVFDSAYRLMDYWNDYNDITLEDISYFDRNMTNHMNQFPHYRIWEQYALAMNRRRKGNELPLCRFLNYLAQQDVKVFEHDGSFLIGKLSNGFFNVSHFAPKNNVSGYNAIKELCSYDNIIFTVTSDLGPMLERIGLYHNDSIQIPMWFRNELSMKNIYTTNYRILVNILDNEFNRDQLLQAVSKLSNPFGCGIDFDDYEDFLQQQSKSSTNMIPSNRIPMTRRKP